MEIQKKIAEQIGGISPKVADDVVEALVNRELSKRSAAIVQALDGLSELEKQLKRTKPDQASYNADGSVASETFSKSKLDELLKLKGKIEKYIKAIDKALTGDMGDVYNLNSNKD